MRRSLGFLVCLAACAATPQALALTQPDGTQIPQGNGLQGMFASRGEAIDALNDAQIIPETFVPSCSLTFEVLQRNAGYQNAFGWYNVTGSVPAIADLHEFLKCSDGVGTVKPLPSIKNDPGYLGGEIGFYEGVVTSGCTPNSGPQNYAYVFYSEKKYNPDSNQANPFIHLLIYNSTVTPKAFYFGWEDLIQGGDNDFDDLTTFVTGISCAGGGGKCQTGSPGVCADGTNQCQNGQLTCIPLSGPSNEQCDGFDNDCNGQVDDGDICPAGQVCDNGNCVPKCGGEFVCPPAQECDDAKGLCVDPKCIGVTCQEGTKCIKGTCKDPCNGVVCPKGQACIAGNCIDPCLAIKCDDTQVCVEGACVDKCQCAGCAVANQCQGSGVCIPDACVMKDCMPGEVCAPDGSCVDACTGVVCPAGQICAMGQCSPDPNATGSGGSAGASGAGGSGFEVGGSAGATSSGGAAGTSGSSSGGSAGSGTGGTGGSSPKDGGCGCRTAGGAAAPASALAAVAGLALASLRRRVRRRSAPARGAPS